MNDAVPPPSYVARARLLDDEAVWRLAPDALELQGGPLDLQASPAAGPNGILRFPYRDIVGVRLYYVQSQLNDPGYYCCALRMRSGRHVEIPSTHAAGIVSSEDRAATYVPFVRALIARVAAANPSARFCAGHHTVRYWLGSIVGLVAIAVLVFMLSEPWGDSLWVKLALVLLFVPLLFAHAMGWGRKTGRDASRRAPFRKACYRLLKSAARSPYGAKSAMRVQSSIAGIETGFRFATID
jgi:hypothetical protein